MKKPILKTLSLAIGLALTGGANAVNLDFSGSNIYMKFLDGNRRVASATDTSGDTASGTDQGQWTEFELRIKATISPPGRGGRAAPEPQFLRLLDGLWRFRQRLKDSRTNPSTNSSKYMKLRGAYVQLTPGYSWLNTALIGSSDWGYFDPFTVGKVRYIDRDNYNGFYFKGPVYGGGTWEAARLSLPNYLQSNYGQGSVCCNSDATQFNEAVYIVQGKQSLGPVKFDRAAISSSMTTRTIRLTPTPLDGTDRSNFQQEPRGIVEGRVQSDRWYRSARRRTTARATATPACSISRGSTRPKSSIGDRAYKLDADFSSLPRSRSVDPGAVLQHRRRLLQQRGGAARNPMCCSPKARRRPGTSTATTSGSAARRRTCSSSRHSTLAAAARCAARPVVSQRAPTGSPTTISWTSTRRRAESVLGWKGLTVRGQVRGGEDADVAGAHDDRLQQQLAGLFAHGPAVATSTRPNSDRKTNIVVFKASHVFPVLGGLEASFKFKRVDDKDKSATSAPASVDGRSRDQGQRLLVRRGQPVVRRPVRQRLVRQVQA